MCLAPRRDYNSKKFVPANTGRTFWLFEEIQKRFLQDALPFKRYKTGCHIIAHAAAHVLKKCGFEADVEMTLQPNPSGGYKPHVVTIVHDADPDDKFFLDFKVRIFVDPKWPETEQFERAGFIFSTIGDNLWIPPGKRYVTPTVDEMSKMTEQQHENYRNLAKPLTTFFQENTFGFVDDLKKCVRSCRDLWV